MPATGNPNKKGAMLQGCVTGSECGAICNNKWENLNVRIY